MFNPVPESLDLQTISPVFQWSLHQDISDEPGADFIESVNRFGLLRPVIVRRGTAGHELICGAKRYLAVRRRSGCGRMTVFVVDETVQVQELLPLIAEDQKHTGPLSPIETARLLSLCEQCDPPLEKHLVQSLTGITHAAQGKQLLSLLQLEEPIRTAIHHGRTAVRTGLLLLNQPASERQFLFDLCCRLSLNSNKQLRLLELSQIIAVADNCSISEVFIRNYPEVCDGTVDNAPQTSGRLMNRLFQLSHPHLTQAKRAFQQRVASLDLPESCHLTPSPAFEQDTVRFEAEFKNFETFASIWKQLKNLLKYT